MIVPQWCVWLNHTLGGIDVEVCPCWRPEMRDTEPADDRDATRIQLHQGPTFRRRALQLSASLPAKYERLKRAE
jgi:hypothetical protein